MSGPAGRSHIEIASLQQIEVIDKPDNCIILRQIDTGTTLSIPEDDGVTSQEPQANVWATFWCVFMLFTSVGWGYDNFAGSAVTGIASWRAHFGVYYAPKHEHIVPITWQYAYNAGGTAAMLLAAYITGPMMDRCGRRCSLMLFSAIWIAGASVQYIAGNIAIYTVGKILCSLCQGGYLTIAPSYVSEVAPTKNRGAFLAATNFFIVVGQFLGTLVQRATDRYAPGPKSYQILFAVQWGFAAIILTGAFFLPESADWCLGHLESSNDYDETELRSSLFRLHGMSGTRADEEVRRLRISFAMDRQAEKVSGNMGYLDCFQGTNFRRTIISLTPPLIQVLCGAGFVLGYQSYFLQITGVAATRSYTITLINYGIFLLGSFLGLLAIERVGRRRMFLAGCYALCISSLLIGIVGESKSMGAKWIFLILISWWGLVYQATLGPIGWAIASESSSRRVRSKTLSMVTMVNAFGNLVFSFINPALINPDKGNLGTKAGFVYGGIMVACSLFSYFWIPEMRGRSYDELDEMFGAKIKARKFSQFMTPHRDQERSCTVK